MNSPQLPDPPENRLSLGLSSGYLRVPAAISDRHLAHCSTVAVLREGTELRVYPVHDAAQGGRLLKVRNAAGDRVVHVGDLLAAGEHADAGQLAARWDTRHGALVVPLPEPQHIIGGSV